MQCVLMYYNIQTVYLNMCLLIDIAVFVIFLFVVNGQWQLSSGEILSSYSYS